MSIKKNPTKTKLISFNKLFFLKSYDCNYWNYSEYYIKAVVYVVFIVILKWTDIIYCTLDSR